jgi:hypothetical protein
MPFKIIRVAENPDREYLVRFFIWGSKGEDDSRSSIRIHKIKMSDGLRDLHSHPWNFWSIILWNGYREHTFDGVPGCTDINHARISRYWPGMINRKSTKDFHALELIKDKPAWTLFFCGRRTSEWGFMTSDGFVNHKNYKEKIPDERFNY